MQKPNILFIFGDQLSAMALESYGGNVSAKTPNIDSLSKNGVTYYNSYCTCPLCTPARASLFSGYLPSKTDLVRNIDNNEDLIFDLNKNFYTLGHYYKDKGYDTAYYGKWHLGKGNINVVEAGFDNNLPDAKDSEKTNQFLNFLDTKNSDKPWLGVVSYIQPHDIYFKDHKNTNDFEDETLPYNNIEPIFDTSPEMTGYRNSFGKIESDKSNEYIKKYRKNYRLLLEDLDFEVGRLLDKLKQTNQLQNTIILFTSDHGDMLGSHKTLYKGPAMYEELIKVPFIISYENVIPKGEIREQCISGTDIFPTLTELTHGETLANIDGISFAKNILDKNTICRDNVIVEWYQHGQVKSKMRAIIKDKYKYLITMSGHEILFDISVDPYELVDLSKSIAYTDIKNSLKQELFKILKDTNNTFVTSYNVDDVEFRHFDNNPHFNRHNPVFNKA